jgi:hypothetical protein
MSIFLSFESSIVALSVSDKFQHPSREESYVGPSALSDVHATIGVNDAFKHRGQVRPSSCTPRSSIQSSLFPPDQSRRLFGVSLSANRKGVLGW